MKQQPIFAISIPNILTVLRILLTPLFVIFLLRDLSTWALLIFALAGISDGLDGFIARYFNQQTLLGAFLDPLADKLLLMSAFVCLAVMEKVPAWLTVIVLSRDILIVLGIAIFTIMAIKVEIKPTLVSKCTTVAQLATIFFTLLRAKLSIAPAFSTSLYWLTAGLTILSGLHYMYTGLNILQGGMGNNQGQK